jgi:hypothetical protein
MNRTHSEYKDPRWQQIRLRVMDRDGWRCVACNSSCTTLNVHHITYAQNIWDTPLQDLQTLCERCHDGLGKHPKGGPYYLVTTDEVFGKLLYVAYRHCPLCRGTNAACHSGCVIFDCDCKHSGFGMEIPKWCEDHYMWQSDTPSGDPAYVCSSPW